MDDTGWRRRPFLSIGEHMHRTHESISLASSITPLEGRRWLVRHSATPHSALHPHSTQTTQSKHFLPALFRVCRRASAHRIILKVFAHPRSPRVGSNFVRDIVLRSYFYVIDDNYRSEEERPAPVARLQSDGSRDELGDGRLVFVERDQSFSRVGSRFASR